MRQICSDDVHVDLAPDRERVTVRVAGEIDIATVADVEMPVAELLDSGFAHVVVDLREVSFMDSSGIRGLISAHQHAETLGARLSIVVGASRTRRTLELSDAIDYLEVS